jgi:predicted glycosyltransferase involved in capsule biosynthesis
MSKSNIIVFSDADIIMEPNQFINSIKLIEQYDMISPYTSVLDLQQNESGLPIPELLKINRAGRGEEDHQKINICGGLSIFRKDAIQRIGGWNEAFIGWGGEDDFQAIKVENFLNHIEVPNKCYHLYHSREQPDMANYQKTLQLLQQLKNLSKEDLIKSINSSIPKIGMSNKYDN